MNRLIIRTFSSDANSNGDLGLGVVELTCDLAKRVLERHRQVLALAAADKQFGSACWFDYSCSFVSADIERVEDVFPAIASDFDDNGWATGVINVEHAGLDPQRTEGDLIHVDQHDFWWSCRPKHCDLLVETMPVPVSVLIDLMTFNEKHAGANQAAE